MKVTSLKLNPDNPRTISAGALEYLRDSIKDFPKMMTLRPIVVDENGMVLGGNQRLLAIQKLEMAEIPDEWVKNAGDLTKAEQQRFIVQDNIQAGGWEWELLTQNWDVEELESWGVEVEIPEIEKVEMDVPDEDETKTFVTEIMIIRNAWANELVDTSDLPLSEAYIKAEAEIMESLHTSLGKIQLKAAAKKKKK